MTTSVLRTSRDGCWELKSNSYGQYLAPTPDPLADTVITQEQLEGFELRGDVTKIPYELWNRWIDLCLEMCKRGTGDLEVSCRILRNESDPSQYRICVPVQKVSGVSVRVDTFDKAVDIATGEVIEQWPPEGWRPCGSSHSHNTMDAFFSGTDDKYELGDPGMHVVVGRIDLQAKTYVPKASVTANNRRFDIDADDVIELDAPDEFDTPTYHPKVLEVITLPVNRQPLGLGRSGMYQSPLPPLGGLDREWSSFTTTRGVQKSAVADEMADVLTAVSILKAAAKAKNLPTEGLLNELIMDIEDSFFDEVGSDLDSPFYWSSY